MTTELFDIERTVDQVKADLGALRVRDAALLFKRWAQDNGLMDAEFPAQIDIEGEDKEEAFDSFGISGNSEAIFRNKGISAVLFDEPRQRVVVLTSRKLTQSQVKILPKEIAGGLPVHYLHGGVGQVAPSGPALPHSRYYLYNNRYACGSSIHPAKYVGAGTLGCLVRDGSGRLLGLSNNHVSGLCSFASRGEKILAPGHVDITAGGPDPFTIGRHIQTLDFTPGVPDNVNIATNSDAAVFEIANPDVVTSMQGVYYDSPVKAIDMSVGQTVSKVGRTTGLTQGVVVGQSVGADAISYQIAPLNGSTLVYFADIFVIQSLTPNIPFSTNGDSGSLVTAEVDGERVAVGLIFAGTNTGLSYALSLPPVLSKLGVSIVNGHNV